MNDIADDVSAIPKYIGGQAGGGAGRTASGLAMLMGNSSKILQTVSANIDRDVFEPLMLNLTDMILLTDTSGLLTGEEKISVEGVQVAIQRETLRQRQVEWLQATNNPTDMQILGIKGRGAALRAVSTTIGLSGEQLVPPDEQLDQMQQAAKQQQANGPVMQQIQTGVMKGVEAGVQRITTELAAGQIAMKLGMPEGMPTHIGTPAGQPPGPGQAAQPGVPMPQAAAQAQGNQAPRAPEGPPSAGNVAGNAPKPGSPARNASPGPA